MAALGWLVSLAQKARPGEGRRGRRRRSARPAEKTPADLRALWDWFYLCVMRYDNAGAFAAGQAPEPRRADRPAGPLGLSVFARAAGSSAWASAYYVTPAAHEPKDNTPPLDKDELDHVLACYRALRARRPELAQAQILQNVANELKRAKRVDEEERFYREAIAGATQLGQIAGAFSLAARAGRRRRPDPALRPLRAAPDRAGRTPYYYTGSFYFSGPGLSLSPGHERLRRPEGVRRRPQAARPRAGRRCGAGIERQSPGAAAPRTTRVLALTGQLQSPVPDLGRQDVTDTCAIAFPLPNEYLDDDGDPGPAHGVRALQARRPLERPGRPLPPPGRRGHDARPTRSTRGSRLSSILWWNDDKDEAIAEFTKVAEASRPESDLRLDLAELLEQQGERADALALADAVQPLDNATHEAPRGAGAAARRS